MIEVRELCKEFRDPKRGRKLVVDRVSFHVKAGEIFGLLGPNGAGKTTTLRMLATILAPSGGAASVCGFDIVAQAADARGNVGFLSGDMGLYPRLTARETLRFFGKLNQLGDGALAKSIDGVINLLEMRDFADVRADKLSTGMRQRLAIGRTIVHNPPVLILDEPTSGLDVPTARLVERFILREREAGKCVLFSTHVMEEAEYLCDRIAVIHEGHITASGTMQELREQTGKRRLREIFLGLLNLEA
ncbi:MAG: ABC transporter ATP-binding protein [Bryobacteraceae bacterium]